MLNLQRRGKCVWHERYTAIHFV